MNRSDVFDNFVKIAQKEGLISESEHAEHTEKDFPETNPRMDSLSIEQIGKLYNNKPQTFKEMEYKRNIIEIAHPESLVISPSYDKLNGLIENENEGQDIRIHISLKEPDGHLVQRKYAEKEFLLSLVRVANTLDNNGQEELRVLADVCLEQAAAPKKKLEKKAIAPLLIIGAIAATAGLFYLQQHMDLSSQGFQRDYQTTDQAIDALLQEHNSWGIGYTYTTDFIEMVTELKQKLATLAAAIEKTTPIIKQVEKPRGLKALKDWATVAQQSETQEGVQAVEELKNTIEEVFPFIDQVIADFKSPGFKQRAIASSGKATSLLDSIPGLRGGSGLMSDKFDALAQDLPTLENDVNGIVADLKAAQRTQQIATQRLQSSKSRTTSIFEHPATPPPGAAPASSFGDVDSKLKELANQFHFGGK
jgi:hypothetical protein